MCLESVNIQGEGVGWKLVHPDFTPYWINSKIKFYKNRWVHDHNNKTLYYNYSKHYKTGFHIYKNEVDALAYQQLFGNGIVIKVKYKNFVCFGQQYYVSMGRSVAVIVARSIMRIT